MEAEGDWSNKGNLFPIMASKYRSSEEKERQVEGLCRFHGLEPGMSKRPVSNVEN